MLSPADAWETLLPHLSPLPPVEVDRRAALGRVLSRDLQARVDVPAADVSAMDGFAVAGEISPGETRPVAATVAAGDPPGAELPAGAAVRIMTGAPVPGGADRVVPVEQTRREGGGVTFREGVPLGAHIRRQGEVLRRGQLLLPSGTLLTPGALALVASHGYPSLPVHRPPRVAVLTTGDEVVPPETRPAPGQLRDSHTDFLLAAGHSLGLSFESLGIAPDRREVLEGMARRGLEADVFLICGGVSAGEFDLVKGVLAELGCTLLFQSVAIQPGRPLVAARHSEGMVFGLPGNPASVMVGFWLFVRPTLRRLMGLADGYWHGSLQGTLAAPLPGAKGRDRFLPAEVAVSGGEILVTPIPPKGSHDLAAYARGTALVRIPAGAGPAPAGTPCEILPLADWSVGAR